MTNKTTKLLSISIDALRYALPHVWRDESMRHVPTSGVLVESNGTLVATDGWSMYVHHNATQGNIARDTILRFPTRIPSAAKGEWLEVELPNEPPIHAQALSASVVNSAGKVLASLTIDEIPGPFPSWRNVVPAHHNTAEPLAMPSFDLAILKRFQCGTKSKDLLTLYPTGYEKPMLVVWSKARDRFGLLSPLLQKICPPAPVPSWLKTTVPSPTRAKAVA